MVTHWFWVTLQEATCLLNDAAIHQSLAFLWETGFKPDSKGNGGIILLKGDDASLFKSLFLDDFGQMFYPDMPSTSPSLNAKLADMIVPIE